MFSLTERSLVEASARQHESILKSASAARNSRGWDVGLVLGFVGGVGLSKIGVVATTMAIWLSGGALWLPRWRRGLGDPRGGSIR